MSTSYTVTDVVSFTVTHARHLASKVGIDLKRLQRFYGAPSDVWIEQYEKELIELLKGGFLQKVTYGFRRDGRWIEPMLTYTTRELAGSDGVDDDAGKIRPGLSISGAAFHSYLIHSPAWFQLSPAQRAAVERLLPFQRSGAPEPGMDGYLVADLNYSAGGRALGRSSLRSF